MALWAPSSQWGRAKPWASERRSGKDSVIGKCPGPAGPLQDSAPAGLRPCAARPRGAWAGPARGAWGGALAGAGAAGPKGKRHASVCVRPGGRPSARRAAELACRSHPLCHPLLCRSPSSGSEEVGRAKLKTRVRPDPRTQGRPGWDLLATSQPCRR